MLKALLLVAAALAAAVSGQQNGVELTIFPDGTYYVLMNGQQWFTSGAYSLVIGGKTYSSRDGSLQLTATTTRTGADPFLGAFNATAFTWTAADPASTPYVTTIYEYSYSSPASDVTYVFEQSFPAAVATGATADSSDTDVVSAFPSFIPAVVAGGPAVNYLTYHDTFAYAHIGHWKTPAFPGGNEGGSPLLWFDDKLNSLILSPLTHFMVGAQTLSASNQNDLSCGFTAKVQTIPAGTVHQTVLYADTGINDALYRWGDILLNTHTYNGGPAKSRTPLDADFALKWLGWWTDNGGAYWYMTENNTDYQQTMLDAKAYNQQIGLPAKYFQLDSWWYPKDQINGVTLWEPMPQVFPSGMSQWLGLPLELHNRWFSPENEYITSGNFTSSFIVEEIAALPIKPDVFTHLMGKAKAWGMFTYEQDWLSFVYRQMQAVRNNIDNGAKWLHAMGDAAAGLDLTVQYCMPLPCHTLQSTKIQPVTQIRSSDDYRPGRTYPPNWEVAHTNMLIWAVGAVPFKDDFWSTTATQWDCPYANATGCQEPNPRLEALISAVTAGPIAPSDRIGSTVPALIMETCRSDGLLLKPDRPATYLDSTFALTFDTLADVKAWHTYSDLGNGCIVHYLLVMDIAQPYVIRPADLGIFAARSFVYEYNSSSKVEPAAVMELDAGNTITVPAAPHPGSNTPRYYRYYVITPILQNGWVFLGEPDKMIPASATRFSNVGVSPQKFTATVIGAPGEVVNTAFIANPSIAPPGTAKQPVTYVYNIPCIIPASGQATASCGGDTCRCG